MTKTRKAILKMNAKTSSAHSEWSGPWIYFALALAWSWLFWIPAAVLSQEGPTLLTTALHYLGGIGPLLAAVVLLYLTQDRAGRRDYWQRVVDFRRISARWYAVILLTVPVLNFLPAVLDILLGGEGIQLEAAARFLRQPLAIVPFAIFLFLFGPLPEEMGWRGYVLDRLQARRSALVASLILGLIWALWHLPLFFVTGTYQHALGAGSLLFWLAILGLIPQSILITWIYNNTRRSTLSAVLFHFMVNFVGELFELSVRAELYQFFMTVLAAILVTAIWGAKTLTRQTVARSHERRISKDSREAVREY